LQNKNYEHCASRNAFRLKLMVFHLSVATINNNCIQYWWAIPFMIVTRLAWVRNRFQTSYNVNVFRCLTAVSNIMHSPLFCNLPVTNTSKRIVNRYLEKRIFNNYIYSTAALSSTLLASIDPNKTSYSLIERIRVISSYIDDANERDLYNIFSDIIFEIFGRGSDKGWELDKLKTKVCSLFFFKFS